MKLESYTTTFVLQEIERLQFFNGLKHEMRYGQPRDTSNGGDSVAEHVYGMHILFEYFWPLEDPAENWDQVKMRQMINFHDVDEVITGDVIGYEKTAVHRAAEAEAKNELLQTIPESMRTLVTSVLHEYEIRESIEAKFVKAIDKIEPVVHLLNPTGKDLLHRMGTTRAQHDSIKLPYFEPFTVIKRFYDVSIEKMNSEGFFRDFDTSL